MYGGSARCTSATYTQNNTNQNKLTQTYTSRVEFEPTIPAFERAKTVHATVIGRSYIQKFIASKSIFYMNRVLREDMFLWKFVMSVLRSSKIKDGWH
jgi:hypothetical protein